MPKLTAKSFKLATTLLLSFYHCLSAVRVKIQKAVAAANGADGGFKEKIINGVKQQPAAACKKCQQKQNKVINFLFGFYHAVAVVAVFQRNHLVLFRGYPVYILTLSYTKMV